MSDQTIFSFLGFQIERNWIFVAVYGKRICGLSVDERRSPCARVVPSVRIFNLVYFRAEIAQNHRAVRPGQYAKGQYFYSVEHA